MRLVAFVPRKPPLTHACQDHLNRQCPTAGLGFLTLSELPEPPRSGHFTVDDDETVRVEAAEEDAKRQLLPLLRQSFQDHDNDSIPLRQAQPSLLSSLAVYMTSALHAMTICSPLSALPRRAARLHRFRSV